MVPSARPFRLVAAYNALGHALAIHHPVELKDPLHHLMELFDAFSSEIVELSARRASVAEIEYLRTTYVGYSVSQWPLARQARTSAHSSRSALSP